MVEKPLVSAFQNFLQIENKLNIKKVMGRNVWMCLVDSVNIGSTECIRYVLLRLRVQNRRKKWNFLLNFRTVAYPGLLLKGPSFRVTE